MGTFDKFLDEPGMWFDPDVLYSLSNALEGLTKLVNEQGAVLLDTTTLTVYDVTGAGHAVTIKWSEDHASYVAKMSVA